MMGISRTSPDLKEDRHAHQNAEAEQGPGQPFGSASLHQYFAQRSCPPPELARSWPRIAPMPRMMAIWPIMLPAPAVKERGTCFKGMPAATPSARAATERPRAACRRRRATRSRSSSTVPATQASKYPSWAVETTAVTGRLYRLICLQPQ